MPSSRVIILSAVVAVGVGYVLDRSLGWATVLSVGAAALVGLAAVMIGAYADRDPLAADAAWRAEAGDLLGQGRTESAESPPGPPEDGG